MPPAQVHEKDHQPFVEGFRLFAEPFPEAVSDLPDAAFPVTKIPYESPLPVELQLSVPTVNPFRKEVEEGVHGNEQNYSPLIFRGFYVFIRFGHQVKPCVQVLFYIHERVLPRHIRPSSFRS